MYMNVTSYEIFAMWCIKLIIIITMYVSQVKADTLSSFTMYHFWLMLAVLGHIATTVISQSQHDFGNPPPLPAKGTW